MTMPGTMFEPSDIVLLPFPFTDLSSSKRRPVLVFSLPDRRGDFLAVQLTSQPGHDGALEIGTADLGLGTLPKATWLRPEKVFTLNTSLVVQRAGQLTPEAFVRCRAAVCAVLGCSE